LSRLSVATVDVGVEVESGVEFTAGPVGGVPRALAVLVTEPESTSAWVIVYDVVHVVEAAGASVVTGHVTAPTFGSFTATAVSVTDPVLVTRKL
jgi:hypothetical protein